MATKDTLKNDYVKNYYDDQVGGLMGRYTDFRWNRDSTGRFDYKQTVRALAKALGSSIYKNAVEIGPGDAVWTRLLYKSVSGSVHLVEQSESMLSQAQKELSDLDRVTFQLSDWEKAEITQPVELVFAIRCFEYFTDKPEALKKMFDTLTAGGRLILVTKNADLYTSVKVQHQTLHSDQVSRSQMVTLLKNAGFKVRAVYPATLRWKIKYSISRAVFDILHRFSVASGGRFFVPLLTRYASESYTYIAERP